VRLLWSLSLTLLQAALACGTVTPELWASTRQAAMEQQLEPELLGALTWVESRYCIDAVSPKGALGLGQLMPATARELGADPLDPAQNLSGAARYLRLQYDTFGDWDLALAAYNAGPGAVRRYGGVPPYAETERYVREVKRHYTRFLELRPGASSDLPLRVPKGAASSLRVYVRGGP
jgi:soluble lytic murein transglycosylase-like protein